MSSGGQSADRQNAFHEVDLKPFFGYVWDFGDGWTLDSRVARQWVLLPGFRNHPPTIDEWQVGQELVNPYSGPVLKSQSS